jgi:hypothetical protein
LHSEVELCVVSLEVIPQPSRMLFRVGILSDLVTVR